MSPTLLNAVNVCLTTSKLDSTTCHVLLSSFLCLLLSENASAHILFEMRTSDPKGAEDWLKKKKKTVSEDVKHKTRRRNKSSGKEYQRVRGGCTLSQQKRRTTDVIFRTKTNIGLLLEHQKMSRR